VTPKFRQVTLTLHDPNPRWMRRALCAGDDPELWFDGDTEEGRRVCAICPVRRDCDSWARENGMIGVWAGLSERERDGRDIRPHREGDCRDGHPLVPSNVASDGTCRTCNDYTHEMRQLARGATLAPCRCGRRIGLHSGYITTHKDRQTGEVCSGSRLLPGDAIKNKEVSV
jgi:WhiB family redox-sensing transcriptional regulator